MSEDTIRKSNTSDEKEIKNLMTMCFGDKKNLEPYNDLENRYYLYFKNNKLVAMTGLTSNSEYNHLEVDWTCTNPEYRHKGYMQKLFKEMLNGVKEDVYCSCWRLKDKANANLHTIMKLHNFKLVIESRVHWKVPHNCFRSYNGGCSKCTGLNCECYEDLYLRTYEK